MQIGEHLRQFKTPEFISGAHKKNTQSRGINTVGEF